MRYIVILLIILAGIAASLGIYFTRAKPETITVEADMTVEADSVLYVEGKMTFCVDSIANKQVYLTHIETLDGIILQAGDIFLITHTVWGKPEEEKDAVSDRE